MYGRQKRRPRFRRTANIAPIRLTDRDRAILRHVREHRFLKTSHILRLIPGSRQNLARRLQRLYHHGLLDRPRAQLPYRITGELREIVHSVDRSAEAILNDHSPTTNQETGSEKKSEASGGLFLIHALSVADVMVAFEASCTSLVPIQIVKLADLLPTKVSKGSGANLFRWYVTVKVQNCTERVGLVPDAVFALEIDNENAPSGRSYYFLEADRGTMPVRRESLGLSSIYRKALAYIESRKSGIVEKRYGIAAFRVLFVTNTSERMRNIMQACKEANGGRDSTMFLFATHAEFTKEESALSFRWHAITGDKRLLI